MRVPTLRIYCETLPFDDLMRVETLALLAKYSLELILAVRPWDAAALRGVMQKVRDAGVPCSIWPMLADEDGRWMNVRNASKFGTFVRQLVDGLNVPPTSVLFDLEPSLSSVQAFTHPMPRQWLRGPRRHAARPTGASARESLFALSADLHARAIATAGAVWPLVALDPHGASVWQRWLGTPVDGVGLSRVSVMTYTSLLEGWSRGALRRPDAMELLARIAVEAGSRWAGSAGISLGCVGTGALADEPVYRAPIELAEDVAIAKAVGCTDLTLFDLGGVMRRPPAAAWLEAFAFGAANVRLTPSARVTATWPLLKLATRIVA
jgi:hypothetical protein